MRRGPQRKHTLAKINSLLWTVKWTFVFSRLARIHFSTSFLPKINTKSVSQNIIQQSIDQHGITFANVLQIIYHQEATAGGQPHEHRYTDRDQPPARCPALRSSLREAPKADTRHKADRHGCCSCRRHSCPPTWSAPSERFGY